MDVIYIDIASLNDPDHLRRISVHRNITLKALLDRVSSILCFEVYRLYSDNKRLIDINDLYDYSIIYAASNISPDQSFSEYQKTDGDAIADFDTFLTNEFDHLKTVVLGESTSGKTSYIFRLINNSYDEEYIPTSIAAEFYHTIDIEGIVHTVSILDTTDKFVEEFDRNWIFDRNLFIITISVNQLDRWKSIIMKYMALLNDDKSSIVLIMITKSDLLDNIHQEMRKKFVDLLRELEKFAEQKNLIVFRTSAKNNKRISGPFLFANKRLQSFISNDNSKRNSFDNFYYKVPAMFRFMDNFLNSCRRKVC